MSGSFFISCIARTRSVGKRRSRTQAADTRAVSKSNEARIVAHECGKSAGRCAFQSAHVARDFPRRLARGLLLLRPFRQTIELLWRLGFASRKVGRQLTNNWGPTFQAAWGLPRAGSLGAQRHPGQSSLKVMGLESAAGVTHPCAPAHPSRIGQSTSKTLSCRGDCGTVNLGCDFHTHHFK